MVANDDLIDDDGTISKEFGNLMSDLSNRFDSLAAQVEAIWGRL